MLGFGFIYHGFPKVFSSEGHTGFVGMLQGMGIPAPDLMAWVVGIVEVLGGLALIVGAFVLIAGSLLGINMLVAMFTEAH
jgi:putative oxidoreductase